MEYQIAPGGALRGELRVPGDKSISHRAAMLAAIAQGETQIQGFLAAEDTLATLAALGNLGVAIETQSMAEAFCLDVRICGRGLDGLRAPSVALDLGNSGTGIRLLAGMLAGQPFISELTGDASLCARPMARIVEPLRAMGAQAACSEALTPPLRVGGARPLRAIHHRSQVASAQVKTCLLFASFYAEGRCVLEEPHPSRDHSERMLAQFGVRLDREAKLRISLQGGQQPKSCAVNVPGDISSAMFFIVGCCIAPDSEMCLRGVGINPRRAAALDLLKFMGADLQINPIADSGVGSEPRADIVVRSSELRGIEIGPEEVTAAIDEIPILLIAAACARGRTRLRGAAELRFKESDRLQAMARGLKALGVSAHELPDGMDIFGSPFFSGGRTDSAGDHRVAMSFAIAALRARSEIRISGCDNVATSFPNFADCARDAGLGIRVA